MDHSQDTPVSSCCLEGFFWGFLGEAIDFYLAEKNLSLLQPAPPDCKFENHPAGLEYVNIR